MKPNDEEYLHNVVDPILKPLLKAIRFSQPQNPITHMIEYLQVRSPLTTVESTEEEKLELKTLKNEIKDLKKKLVEKGHIDSEEYAESDENEDDYLKDSKARGKKHSHRPRMAVSAEAYGEWNKVGSFHPTNIPKTSEQKKKILELLNQTFIFKGLETKAKEIIINAMEEELILRDSYVIRQGDEGDKLFIVETGTLTCKRIGEGGQEFEIAQYQKGDLFGELALLYNTPRTATIITTSDCILWSLDRTTFNHISKESTMKKRVQHMQFLSSVQLLETMNEYERGKLVEVLHKKKYNKGDYIINEGDEGEEFYILESGKTIATKTVEPGQPPEIVMHYAKGDYFGELALLKNTPRAANIIAQTDCTVLCLYRATFKRLLGSLEEILKRNMKMYEKNF